MTVKDYPKEWQLKIIAGALDSYHHIHMTDCTSIFDSHMKSQDRITENLELIETAQDLYDLYFMLHVNGIWNLNRLFNKTFKRIEKKYQDTPELNIWDYRVVKELYENHGY